MLATADGPQRALVARTLEHWQQDSDLTGIRHPDALAKLPDEEGVAFTQLWADVAALLERAKAARSDHR